MNAKPHRFTSTLTSAQRAALKGKAHALKPVVMVGASGLSRSVLTEVTAALEAHELIKIQLPGQSDADDKKEATEELERMLPEHAHLVSRVGRMVVLYKEKHPSDAEIKLKDL